MGRSFGLRDQNRKDKMVIQTADTLKTVRPIKDGQVGGVMDCKLKTYTANRETVVLEVKNITVFPGKSIY